MPVRKVLHFNLTGEVAARIMQARMKEPDISLYDSIEYSRLAGFQRAVQLWLAAYSNNSR